MGIVKRIYVSADIKAAKVVTDCCGNQSLYIPGGNSISSITKTGTVGLVDTYTILYTDGTSDTFTVTNGKDGRGIISILKTGTVGLVDTYTITYTTGAPSTFTVTNGAKGDKGDPGPQGVPGTPGGSGVPLNYFDGWTTALTTTLNGGIILPTSITQHTNDGIAYNKTTGIVRISNGWWFVQYGFTALSTTAQTLTTYVTQDGVTVPPSRLDQPLLANQPQTISRTFVVSASTNFNLAFIAQTAGIQLSQINWFVKMLED